MAEKLAHFTTAALLKRHEETLMVNLYFFILRPSYFLFSPTVALNLRVTVTHKIEKVSVLYLKLPFRFHSHPRPSWAQL